MSITAQQVLTFIGESDLRDEYFVDCSKPDASGEITIIINNSSAISAYNDALNAEFNPNWPTQRAVYKTAGDAKRLSDLARSPKMHPSNAGPTGGNFATLEVTNGELTEDTVHLQGMAPYLLPDGMISIENHDGIALVFSDDHSICSECRVLLETQCSGYGWEPQFCENDSHLCKECCSEECCTVQAWVLGNDGSTVDPDYFE